MELPKFSVITPSYNQGKYIKDTIESVLAQDYPNFEHIIIDGGSTDQTVEILKKYSHLQWVSEPDQGQADALNKGFARATGDIIAWINSDDWYAPETFKSVAENFKTYPVITGMCSVVDDKGTVLYTVPNTERNWFDVLKYWVPYSIPTQPSIFFGRKLLEHTQRSAGNYLDKNLYYTMDYDLWLRTALEFPFVKRVEKVFSFYRSTETSKTSHDVAGMAYAEPEMSYVFHRAETMATAPTYNFSFIVPVTSAAESLKTALQSMVLQSSKDFGIVLVDCSGNRETSKQLKEIATTVNRAQNTARLDQYIRVVDSHSTDLLAALNKAIETCESRLIGVLPQDCIVGSDFVLTALQLFGYDRIGLCLPFKNTFNLANHYSVPKEFACPAGQLDFKLDALFSAPSMPQAFVARKVALLEIGDFISSESWALNIRKLILRSVFKAWHVSINNSLPVTFTNIPNESVDINKVNAEAICDLPEFYSEDLFFKARSGYGVVAPVSEDMIKQCKQLLGK